MKYRDPEEESRWVRIEACLTGGDGGTELTVRVRDNGIGVPAEAQDQLFTRFFRAAESTVTGEEGTGLGLSLVRDAVDGLGGIVWFEPAQKGSVFALRIPLEVRLRDGGDHPDQTCRP